MDDCGYFGRYAIDFSKKLENRSFHINRVFCQLKNLRKKVCFMTEGRLGYNPANDRYGLLVSDLWVDSGFCCGECLEVLVDGKWISTRMEMSAERKWYLVDTPYYGKLEYVKVRI